MSRQTAIESLLRLERQEEVKSHRGIRYDTQDMVLRSLWIIRRSLLLWKGCPVSAVSIPIYICAHQSHREQLHLCSILDLSSHGYPNHCIIMVSLLIMMISHPANVVNDWRLQTSSMIEQAVTSDDGVCTCAHHSNSQSCLHLVLMTPQKKHAIRFVRIFNALHGRL